MRAALLCVLWLGACGFEVREPSPASAPVRALQAPALPPQVDPAVFAAAVRAGVRQRSANESVFEVDAFLAALTVEDLRSGRPSVTLSPVLADGRQSGYQVAGVREGSVYAAIGLLDGDVVEAINNVPLDGSGQALQALAGGERGVVLQISRAGVSKATELRISGGLAWASMSALYAGPAEPVPEDPVPDEPVPEETVPRMELQAGSGSPVPGVRPTGGKPTPASQPSSASKPGSTSKPAAAGSSSSSSASTVQCAADGSCSVGRGQFDAMVADPNKLLRQVQVSEANNGFRLSGIRGGSDVSKLGFRNGDVLLAINGTQLDDQFGLLGLYGGLGSTRTYNVTYERGGVRHTRTIRLRDGA